MPPRKKKNKPVKRDKAISLLGLTEAYVMGDIVSRGTTGSSLWDFFVDGWNPNSARKGQGINQLTLYEMIYGNTATSGTVAVAGGGYASGTGGGTVAGNSSLDVISTNIKNTWFMTGAQLVLVPIGFRVLKRATSGFRREMNKGFKMAGIRSEVKA